MKIVLIIALLLTQYIVIAQHIFVNPGDSHIIACNQTSKDTFELQMQVGDYAFVTLLQQDVDVLIEVYDKADNLIEKFDSPNGGQGNEIILIDANYSGNYKLVIKPLGKKNVDGSYLFTYRNKTDNLKEHLDSVLKFLFALDYIPGLAVSLVDSSGPIFTGSYGYADIEKKIPFTTKTTHCIASISKTFIGLSIMKLAEEGKLDLDEDINTYLPFQVHNPYAKNHKITLRHLASHTAAIRDDKFYKNAFWYCEKQQDLGKYHRDIRKELKTYKGNKSVDFEEYLLNFYKKGGSYYSGKNFFKRASGEKWYYSNIGAGLAAYIVQVVSGVNYSTFVRETFILPLGMNNTYWGLDGSEENIPSKKYDKNKTVLPELCTANYPDGNLYSNSEDLSIYLTHWIKAHKNGSDLLDKPSYDEIMTIQHEEFDGDFKGRRDGIFFEIGKTIMGHSGGDLGISARMFFAPKTGKGFTTLENTMPSEDIYANVTSRQIKSLMIRYCRK